jgi:hypothetical protein
MSVVCTVTAASAVYLSAGVLSGIATATATVMGLRQLHQAEGETVQEEARDRQAAEAAALVEAVETVELSTRQTEALKGLVAERCHLVFTDGKLRITLTRNVRGELKVKAHGENTPRAEVAEQAERFLGLLLQQVAYREVVTKMKRYGLDVQQEARAEDGTVKLRISRRR